MDVAGGHLTGRRTEVEATVRFGGEVTAVASLRG